jgi:hypothetical protein
LGESVYFGLTLYFFLKFYKVLCGTSDVIWRIYFGAHKMATGLTPSTFPISNSDLSEETDKVLAVVDEVKPIAIKHLSINL